MKPVKINAHTVKILCKEHCIDSGSLATSTSIAESIIYKIFEAEGEASIPDKFLPALAKSLGCSSPEQLLISHSVIDGKEISDLCTFLHLTSRDLYEMTGIPIKVIKEIRMDGKLAIIDRSYIIPLTEALHCNLKCLIDEHEYDLYFNQPNSDKSDNKLIIIDAINQQLKEMSEKDLSLVSWFCNAILTTSINQ